MGGKRKMPFRKRLRQFSERYLSCDVAFPLITFGLSLAQIIVFLIAFLR